MESDELIKLIKEEEKLPFLKSLAGMAAIDGAVEPGERAIIGQFFSNLHLSAEDKEELERILDHSKMVQIPDEAKFVTGDIARRYLLQQIVVLAHADGDFSQIEYDCAVAITQRCSMDPNLVDQFDDWVKRGQQWAKEGAELVTGTSVESF